MASSLVAHRRSLAYTGRDLTYQVIATGRVSRRHPGEDRQVAGDGVDHCCDLMFSANSVAERNE